MAADFFLDILKTPDKVCELKAIKGDDDNPDHYRFELLSNLWKNHQRSMSPDRDVPTSCFDEELAGVLASEMEMQVRSETRDGKIWASLKANNSYQTSASAVDTLGIWPDKLLAAQMLVRRDTPNMATENSGLALIDLPHRSTDKAEELYNHMKKLVGLFENGVRQDIFVDKDGEYLETVNRYVQPVSTMIEATPSYLWPMKRYFSMGGDEAFSYWTEGAYQDTTVPYFGTLLTNLDKYSRVSEYGLSDSAKRLRDELHINLATSSYHKADDITFTWKGKSYSINTRNRLANAVARQALYADEQQEMINKLNKSKVSRSVAEKARKAFEAARDAHQARIVGIGDKDALNAIKRVPAFFLENTLKSKFKEHEVDGNKCLRFSKDGESEADHLKRKCNSVAMLTLVVSEDLKKVDEDDYDRYFDLAQQFGEQVTEGMAKSSANLETYKQQIKDAEDAKDQVKVAEATKAYNETQELYDAYKAAYDANPADLRQYVSNSYPPYRRLFEQFPVYDD